MTAHFIKKISSKLFSYFGRESASFILCLRAGSIKEFVRDNRFYFVSDVGQIKRRIGGLRLETKMYHGWVTNGSLLCIADLESKEGVPRGWLHFKGVRSLSSFNCAIGDNAAWLGPDFIPVEHRGKKLHSCLIAQRSLVAFDSYGIDVLFTGINVNNVASLKNYINSGYQIVGVLRSRRFFFLTRKNKSMYIDIVSDQLKIE